MSARAVSSSKSREILYLNYNQDYSLLCVGTRSGFKVFSTDPFSLCFQDNSGGVRVVEMWFSSTLVAYVGAGDKPDQSPRTLHVMNTKLQKTIASVPFKTTVLNVLMNKKRLVVVELEEIHVFELPSLERLHSLDTVPNPKGIATLSPHESNSFLAFPANEPSGEVLIYDAMNLSTVNVVSAHKAPISALCFDKSGQFLATAGEKGTVVRVFSVPKLDKCFSFRRGSRPATIYSLAFNATSSLLGVSSDTGTVHIYKLDQGKVASGPEEKKKGKYAVLQYLPEAVSGYAEPIRSWSSVHLSAKGVSNRIAFDDNNEVIFVATEDGVFYEYLLPASKGGECKLHRENLLLQTESEQIATRIHD